MPGDHRTGLSRPEDPALIFEDLTISEFASLPAIATEGGSAVSPMLPLYGPGGHPVGTFCVYDAGRAG